MKKLLTILLASLVVAGFAACSNETSGAGSSEGTSSVASVASEASESSEVSESSEASEASSSADASSDEEDTDSSEESDDESAEPDTTGMSNPYVFEELAIDLPEGFVEQDGIGGINTVVPDDYPEHSDNFTFTSAAFDGDKSPYTKEAIEEVYTTGFSDAFSGIDQFDEVTVDGCDAIVTKYNITYSDMEMTQQQLYVFTDDTIYIVSFTSASGDYTDAFDTAYKTVKVAK